MTDRHDPDRTDPAASLPPKPDLPTAGRQPPHQAVPAPYTPDDDPAGMTPPPRTPGGTQAGGPGAETKPIALPSAPGDVGQETKPIALPGAPSDAGQQTKPIALPSAPGDAGQETKPISLQRDAPRDHGGEVTTRLVAPVAGEEPTVERERPAGADPNGPTQRLWSSRDEQADRPVSARERPAAERRQEPEPATSAERVNHPGGVDTPVAVGNGDGRVPNDDLGETADRAAEAAAERRRETPAAAAGRTGGETPKASKRWRLSPAGALIWVLLALFGFTLVVQLRTNNDDQGLATARQEDLVGILSDLEARDSRLQTEIAGLESSQRQLTSGVSSRQAALAEAAKRADELGLLAGTLPGKGPGLKIVIDKVKASAILNAVEELRGAGGEVMELAGANGVTVRVVASSYFVDAEGGGIVADGARVTGPYTLWVIGSPQTMQTALQIPGGVVASVNSAGGSVTMEAQTLVQVAAVRKATTLQYAHPVS